MQPKRPNNYVIMEEQARERFLTYDQSKIIQNSPVKFDESFLYLPVLDTTCRVSRETGHVTWLESDQWIPSPRQHDTMTVYDYLCDASPNRSLSGEWRSTAALGSHVHSELSEKPTRFVSQIDKYPDTFCKVCDRIGGIPFPHCDIGYTLRLFPDLPFSLQFWHSDEEFSPRLRFLWDTNTAQFIRYETTYFAMGLIQARLQALMTAEESLPQI